MSSHIYYDHQCQKCKAFYIPYEKDIVCPNCGLNEKEIYDIVPEIVGSAEYHKVTTGSYTPLAFFISSLGDRISLQIYRVLDAFYKQDKKNFQEFSKDYFNNMEWKEHLYMKNHLCDLSYKVFLELQTT